ncbi:MAG: hypothetical protein ABSG99_07805 [Sedimentisphaerales bacterium]
MKIHKKLYLLLTVLAVVSAVVVVVFALLLHRPSFYKPLDLAHSKEVSLYLTNELLPELYNGAQLQEPFNLVVTQSGINDIVARFDWPKEFGGIRFSAPMVFFAPDSIVLMGMVSLEGAEFVVTVIARPNLDAKGLLNLQVVSVKIGAVDITPLAGVLAGRIYQQQFGSAGAATEDFWARTAASLVNGKPFEPVFKIEDKKVRVEKITIEQKKLTIRLVPVFD